MSKTSKYIVKSFFWGTVAKILDAVIKFISVPLLLTYFGKENFGLITLAMSVNAYLQILDMGVNTGSIKHFSEWISEKKFRLLDSVARTSISFYGLIGIFNAIILIILAIWGLQAFALTSSQELVMRNLFLILAMIAIVNWSTSVFNQLLIANENIAFVQRVNILRSLLGLIVIYATIQFKWELVTYFTWFSIVNSIILVPNYLKAKHSQLIRSFKPAFDWTNFYIIFKYSLAIIMMSIFQMTATKMRPIVLSIFSKDGIGVLADYRVMETITIFIISIGGMFISIFLPKTSKLLLENDHKKVELFAYQATEYTSIICIFLCFPFIINAKEIITVYVGNEYAHLFRWLIIWIITILIYLHNSPISSLVLSTGKTRMLVYSSAFSCIFSLIINAALCKYMNVGSAVIGYAIYILIQMSFYYFYFNQQVLKLNSLKVLRSFIIPTLLGSSSALLIFFLQISLNNLFFQITLKSILWAAIFVFSLIGFKIINIKAIMQSLRLHK